MVKFVRMVGSIKFTVVIITFFAIAVIMGTVIESMTGSHKAASGWIYSHPLFLALLWAVFANILFATFKRYPFKKRHIPFLITHLGLLMVFGGTLLKISFGEQGSIALKEGNQTRHFSLDDSLALSYRQRGHDNWNQIPLKRNLLGKLQTRYQDQRFNFQIKGFAPHGEEKIQTWIKGDKVIIIGHPPIPLNEAGVIGKRSIIASKNPEVIKDKLKALPALVFLEDENEDITLLDVDEAGEIKTESFSPHKLSRLYAYDEGFGGYTVPFQLKEIEIETPITRKFKPLPSPKKLEEERPILSISINDLQESDEAALAFASILPTPALKGEVLLKLEPLKNKLPQPLRLRSANATLYPNSTQTKSFEAKLYYGKNPIDLSMNQVWESPEGYRFYLANMTPLDESDVKEVRLVVNRDPFKYILTYPGALILALGIFLLFKRPRFLS